MASPQDIVAALSKLEESLVERLTTRIDQRFGEFRLEVNARFDAVEARFERLEVEYQMIVAALRRIEESLAEDRGERTRLLTDVAELKKRVALLDARIRELEARLSED
jgi:chromosome segregation ATPase